MCFEERPEKWFLLPTTDTGLLLTPLTQEAVECHRITKAFVSVDDSNQNYQDKQGIGREFDEKRASIPESNKPIIPCVSTDERTKLEDTPKLPPSTSKWLDE